ncbi:MAG: hypothetical protein K1X83_10730 [Oligoflexia bacterium]|nr:hypothetical protein [Oligoflexia bacterium]
MRRVAEIRIGVLLLGCLILTVGFIYKTALYRRLFGYQRYQFVSAAQAIEAALSYPENQADNPTASQVRTLKISFPISLSGHGCELVYGLAKYYHLARPEVERTTDYSTLTPRYLFKFRYDLKNKRCESKDLFIEEQDRPSKIDLEFVKSSFDQSHILEAPLGPALQLKLNAPPSTDGLNPQLQLRAERTLHPSEVSTTRAAKFSFNAAAGHVELLIHPQQDLYALLAEEIDRRIVKCQSTSVCDSIKVAVARITDLRVLQLLDKASAAGLMVEAITNYMPRHRKEQYSTQPQHVRLASFPWLWLRGNPFAATSKGILPMHTKFIVFGDDLVWSSNMSLNSDRFYKSRQFSTIYRSKEAVRIFQEIFALIRTSLFYPLRVDSRDAIQILLNADRPRGYSASSRKPYLSIDTESGLATSAYGILYHRIEAEAGPLKIVMAPITSSCQFYGRELCLFDLLRLASDEQRLELYINSWFYFDRTKPNQGYFWNDAAIKDNLSTSKSFDPLRQLFSEKTRDLHLMSTINGDYSLHHERLALLGDNVAVMGSANWAQLSTINTIEIVDDRSLYAKLAQELNTFTEAYYVSRKPSGVRAAVAYKDCEFSFERDLLRNLPSPAPFYFEEDCIRAQLWRDYPAAMSAAPEFVIPQYSAMNFSDPALFSSMALKRVPLAEALMARSSYQCMLNPQDGSTLIVRFDQSCRRTGGG